MKYYKLDLSTGVQAFFLLQAANLTPDLEKLVRTTAILVYGDIKKNFKKCWVIHVIKTPAMAVEVKEEDCE